MDATGDPAVGISEQTSLPVEAALRGRRATSAGGAQAEGAPRAAAKTSHGAQRLRCGEKIAFEEKYLNTVVGTIVRINQRIATIDPGDGTTWRVPFALLRHVVDIRPATPSSRGR